IVARRADATTFEKVHVLAKAAKDDTERRRYYSALMLVSDEALAARAAQIALSPEIPPQFDAGRLNFVLALARQHQALAWKTFRDHNKELLKSHSPLDSLIIAQYVPEVFWNGIPLDQLETWIRGHVSTEMNDTVERGLQGARYKLAEKQVLLS